MSNQENSKPYWSIETYWAWIFRAEKNPKFCTAAQLDRYREAVAWYDRKGGEDIEKNRTKRYEAKV